jgi:ketosteroid isomerase-like protein
MVCHQVARSAASGEFLARRPFTHPTQRLWQVLTMRDGKIVHIHDYTNQATALQAAGLPTGP